MVRENLENVEKRILNACQRVGRHPEDVTLVCVSKTKPAEMIQDAYGYGKREFGENKAQELREKYDVLPKDIIWHFIGHLQTNKVKYVVGRAGLIHSVDSCRLAQAIEAESVKKGVVSHILVEVNVAQEASKFGLRTEETLELVKQAAALPHLRIDGLMTIAPFVENPEQNRPVFQQLRELSVDIDSKNIDNVSMGILSMGMTNDYEIAIEEGATHVRVGTGIFGERNYHIEQSEGCRRI
ncbi:MAG: YggS family pyridoxal phosphate-dependent enzyme [Clostridiaceae bacterium]|nr:YggS family pyridoxal phosphate-dependent enzyme [Clostridiaceae bacterium]